MAKKKKLSSLEKLLLGIDPPQPETSVAPLQKGDPCPACEDGILDYNGLLQLECPICGFVAGNEGSCT